MPNDSEYRPDAEKNVERGDLRDMLHAKCESCGYEWHAPKAVKCPRCHDDRIKVLGSRMIGIPRV